MFTRMLLLLLLLPGAYVSATPKIQHWQTGNGVDVFFVETHELPMLDVQVVFDAGSSRDGDTAGIAMLTSGLLDEGAGGLSADQVSQGFEDRGAIYSSHAGYDSTTVSLRTLVDKEKLTPVLENLRRVLTQPDFPQESFDRQRNRTLIGIRQKQQSPADLARDAFFAAVYDDHPYAHPGEGTEESVQSLTRGQVRDFHQRYYVARNAMIAMVGDIDRAQAEQVADYLTAEMKDGDKAPSLPPVAALAGEERVILEHPSAQTHILVGQPGVKRGDPDYFPLYVGNHVLGGGGMISRLFEEIREKRGLSYSAYSYFSPMREAGPFIAGLQTRTDQAQIALEVLLENIRTFIDQGPSEQELAASKKNITGGFPLQLDSNRDILNYLGVIGFYGLPLDYLETFTASIEAVTVAGIKDAFKRRLTPDKLAIVILGQTTASRGGED